MDSNLTCDSVARDENDPVLTKTKRQPGSRRPKSSFGSRFHRPGRPNVYFRKDPDLTSDPCQTWVAFDSSDIQFKNCTPSTYPLFLESDSSHEESEEEYGLPIPKRQKRTRRRNTKLVDLGPVVTGFRVSHPLKTDIYEDVWRMILKESHPTVLLIFKNLSSKFHKLLQEQSIWKAARIKLHGEDAPDPPGNMSEQRYAHLLHSHGCDFRMSTCGSTVTKKVYWAFRLRMCDACYRRKVVKVCRTVRPVLTRNGC
jgi:hypothetical protein